jgi:glycosyltransferase involved in cell wall biosynthesis
MRDSFRCRVRVGGTGKSATRMILAIEQTWTGTLHAATNSGTLQTLARAFPGEPIHVFAEATHLAELQRDAGSPAMTFHPIAVSPHFRGKTHIVSTRRFAREAATLLQALRRSDPRQDCLMVLMSATPTAILAAAWLLRLFRRRRLGVQVVLHGNLNDINGWRPRNPLRRRFDLLGVLGRPHPPGLRFVVLDEAIREALGRILPGLLPRVDVFPLPINLDEVPTVPPCRLEAPVRIGFVGLATAAKGIDTFLRVAAASKQRFGTQVEFQHVGRVPEGSDLRPFQVLAQPPSTAPLERTEFLRRMAQLHYVLLPYRRGYYDLSASGALVDAMTCQKPIVATRIPFIDGLFAAFGDIGHACDDEAGLAAAVETIMGLDQARYDRQVAAMGRVRSSRLPEALAPRYRDVVASGYGGLLTSGPDEA